MEKEKMKVLLYLKKSDLDKSGKAPIMGRITIGRSIAQFSCKLSCNPDLWNPRESRMDGKSRHQDGWVNVLHKESHSHEGNDNSWDMIFYLFFGFGSGKSL